MMKLIIVIAFFSVPCSSLKISISSDPVDFKNDGWKADSEIDLEASTELESPTGFKGTKGAPTFWQLHIPKTGGSALTVTLQQNKDWINGAGVEAHEGCYNDMKQRMNVSNGDKIITFVREPYTHVVSQFNQCCINPAGGLQTSCAETKNLKKYVDYFDKVRNAENIKPCYSAYNLQTRAFTCWQPIPHPGDSIKGNHKVNGSQPIEEAIQNLHEMYFVGILEYFKESLCVLYTKQHDEFPSWCNCEDKEAFNSWAPSHFGEKPTREKFKTNPYVDVPLKLRKQMNHFVSDDLQLYKLAKERFHREVDETEAKFGKKLMCKRWESQEEIQQEEVRSKWDVVYTPPIDIASN
eukprot:gnl/MRDRNA2_/MRDRNA2_74202_c0_seq2.p1 gnl/MRDRNA2_/MRDRNA2_74202_c0~~gnl/MRDRNA2_/MRDRNA2_74202_c0_seq2.p1  ORF type:complete len:351 (-),score=60.69 gnl/MRDRNA2_/MRDRNA2_74202_c0_seq2:72-1124(-)